MIKKENYAAPATEVLELRLEGAVLIASIGENFGGFVDDESEPGE